MGTVNNRKSSLEFNSRINKGITLVDFNAEWCVPCREQREIVEKLAELFSGKATMIGLDVDHHPETAVSLGVTSIPTLIVFKDGKELKRFIGRQTEDTLKQSLNQAIQSNSNKVDQ